jgi:hypothetical protein
MAKAKHSNALPTLAQQAANLQPAAPVVQAAQAAAPVVQAAQAAAPKVLGARTIAVAAASYLPTVGHMAVNVASLQRTKLYHENGNRQQCAALLGLLIENAGKAWPDVAAAINAAYPPSTVINIGGKVGKASVSNIMKYLQRKKGPISSIA